MPGRPGGSTNVGQDFRAECLKTGLYAEAVRNDPGKKMDFRRQAKGYRLRPEGRQTTQARQWQIR